MLRFKHNRNVMEAHKPVSRIIREAVEQYLSHDEKKAAKERVLSTLSKSRPLGGLKKWEELHKERTGADADRSYMGISRMTSKSQG